MQQVNSNRTANNAKRPKPPKPRRYIIPLEQWKRFEKFKQDLPEIEDAIATLQENWNFHIAHLVEELQFATEDFDDVHDALNKLSNLINGNITRKNGVVRNRPQYQNMIAEILIEDISENGEGLVL